MMHQLWHSQQQLLAQKQQHRCMMQQLQAPEWGSVQEMWQARKSSTASEQAMQSSAGGSTAQLQEATAAAGGGAAAAASCAPHSDDARC